MMQPYSIDYRNSTPLVPYQPKALQNLAQIQPQYDQDGRFWGFGLLPFVGGLLLGGVGGYALGNNYGGKYCGGYAQGGYPYPYPYPQPQPYPYPVPAGQGTNMIYEQTAPISYTSNENFYLQPAQMNR